MLLEKRKRHGIFRTNLHVRVILIIFVWTANVLILKSIKLSSIDIQGLKHECIFVNDFN